MATSLRLSMVLKYLAILKHTVIILRNLNLKLEMFLSGEIFRLKIFHLQDNQIL